MTVIVLDNDETTGYYTHMLTYMGFVARCLLLTADQEASIIATIAEIAKTNGVFRPGTEAFLQGIAERKRLGIVSSVVMYTNALANPDMSWYTTSGIVDWPHFIARVLSHLAGDPALFDVVLSRPPHLAHIPYPKKNFVRVTDALAAAGRPVGDDERIIFFDDKPGEIMGASERFVAWFAPEYKVPLTLEQIDAMLERILTPDTVFRWAAFTTPVIRSQIHAMSIRCKDSLTLPSIVALVAPGAWCGFDLDTHLPLPPVPEPTPAPPTPIIESETTEDADAPPTRRHSSRSRRIRLHIELTLNISVGRRHKKKWGVHSSSPIDVSQSLHSHHRKHISKY